MPEKALCKVKNVSGSERTLDGRQVVAGAVIEVPEDAVYGLTSQQPNSLAPDGNWKPADKATQKVHDEAHAAQLERNNPQPESPAEPEATDDSAAAEEEN